MSKKIEKHFLGFATIWKTETHCIVKSLSGEYKCGQFIHKNLKEEIGDIVFNFKPISFTSDQEVGNYLRKL